MSYNQLRSAVREMRKDPKALYYFVGSRLPLKSTFEEKTRLEYMVLKYLISHPNPTQSHKRTSTKPMGKQGASKPSKRPRSFSSESDSDSSEDARYISGLGWAFAQGDDVEDEWAGWELVRTQKAESRKPTRDNKRQRVYSSSSSSSSEDEFRPASSGLGLLFSNPDMDDEMYLDEEFPTPSSRDSDSVKTEPKLAFSKSFDSEEDTPVINQPVVVPVAQSRRLRRRQEPIVISSSSSSSSEEDPPYVFNFERLKNAIDPVLLPEYIEPMRRRVEDLEKYEFIELQDSPTSLPTRMTRSLQRYLNATSQ